MNQITVKNGYEYWQVNGSDVIFYTEDLHVKDLFRREVGYGATYERNGKVFGWHFIVPKYETEEFKKRIAALKTSQNRQLSGSKNA